MSVSANIQSNDDFFSFLDNKNTKNTRIEKNKDNNVWSLLKECKHEDDDESEQEPETNSIKSDIDDEPPNKCEYCGEEDCLINDYESIVCTKCGREGGMIIDTNPEWRFYGTEDNKRTSDPNRCGLPVNKYIKNGTLSIVILGFGNEQFRKVNSYHGISYKERSILTMLNLIMNKASIANMPQSVIDRTIILYQEICAKHVRRGTAIITLVAACFSHALKEKGVIKNSDEIAKLFDIPPKKFSKGCTEFSKYLVEYNKENTKTVKKLDIKEQITQYAKVLDFNEEQTRKCLYAMYVAHRIGLCPEHNYRSIGTGILYLVSEYYGMPYTKKDLSDFSKVSEVTLGNIISQLSKFREHLIPDSSNNNDSDDEEED